MRALFQGYHPKNGQISKDSLFDALSSLKLVADKDDARLEELPRVDLDNEDREVRICFDDFKAAVLRPLPIETWCKQIPLWEALADAIPCGNQADQQLRVVTKLTEAHIDVICTEVQLSMRNLLRNEVSKLRTAFQAMDLRDAGVKESKFSTVTASVGSSQDYYHGLTKRVGIDNFFHICIYVNAHRSDGIRSQALLIPSFGKPWRWSTA